MDSPDTTGLSKPRFCLVLLFLFLIHYLPCALSVRETRFCRRLFECGGIKAGFPFSGGNRSELCGHPFLKLHCDKASNTTSIEISGLSYNVLHIDTLSNSVKLARGEDSDSISFCPGPSPNAAALPPEVFERLPGYEDLSVSYKCDPTFHYLDNSECPWNSSESVSQNTRNHTSCPETLNVTVPTSFFSDKKAWSFNNLKSVLKQGFEVKVKFDDEACRRCLDSKGSCAFRGETQICCTEDSATAFNCHMVNQSSGVSLDAKTLIGSILIGSVFLLVIFVFLCWRAKISKDKRKKNLKVKELIPLKRYRYSELKNITKSFTHVVGRGGFGTVYRGNLLDGRKVAVKVLKNSNGDGEEFINEVATMSKTSHVNIVSLLGFCYEGTKRAIIYEFLENGSLDKLISSMASVKTDWRTLYEVALGVARGLEYLHYGCKTRIVHFDIKPQNVLLDNDLCPKVSDFGLAKLCEKKESVMSLSDARGTIGYIAPEVFSRMYGNVSHKSDVYSYGMLVLEMIGARNIRADNSATNTSSMYFPDSVHKDLETGQCTRFLEDEISEEEEEGIVKKMIMVATWCIQSCPSHRPSMNRVVEMMEGNLDDIEVPPKPTLHLPTTYLSESQWASEESLNSSEV